MLWQQTIRIMFFLTLSVYGTIVAPWTDRGGVVFGDDRIVVPKFADEVHVRVDGDIFSLSETPFVTT